MTKNNWKKLIAALICSGILTKTAEIALKALLTPFYPKSPFLWVVIKEQSLILLPLIFHSQTMSEYDLDLEETSPENNYDED